MNPIIANLQKLLHGPRDGALLRFSIGSEYLKAGDPEKAAEYLRGAIEKDAKYSAAWKLLGKALAEAGRLNEAIETYRKGQAVAQERGDRQAAREMSVFARRVEKQLGASGG